MELLLLFFCTACSTLDPEIPEGTSDISNEFPNIWLCSSMEEGNSTTMTTASISWKILSGDVRYLKRIYLCYKNYKPEIPADTTDLTLDLLPLIKAKEDHIAVTGLEPSCRYHFRLYIETLDSSAYTPYEFLNHFSTKPNVRTEAWKRVAGYPEGNEACDILLSFSTDSFGFAGLGYNEWAEQYIFFPSLYRYSPIEDRWEERTAFPGCPRYSYVSFQVGQCVYVGLGRAIKEGQLGEWLKDFWVYDITTDAWKQLADFPGVQRIGAHGFSCKEKGYVLYGDIMYSKLDDFWAYTPSSDTWEQKTIDLPDSPYESNDIDIFTYKDRAFLSGADIRNLSVSYCYEYISATNSWEQRASCPYGNRSETYSFELEKSVIMGGGYYYFLYERPQWQYFPEMDKWKLIDNPPVYLAGRSVNFTISGKGYAGYSYNGIWQFDLTGADEY